VKKIPFKFRLTNPGSRGKRGSRNAEYLKKNPSGTIPMLEDGSFSLAESNAIIIYMANKNQWFDIYPDEYKKRARVDWYLHFHNRNVRDLTTGIVMPKFRKDIETSEEVLASRKSSGLAALQEINDSWLDKDSFLAGNTWTLADLVAYAEIGQLQFLNLHDFSKLHNVSKWIDRMKLVPFHNEIHLPLEIIGDISETAPSMDKMVMVNKTTTDVLENTGIVTII